MAVKRRPSTLESHVGYWLRLLSNHVSHQFSLKMESKGVTVAEWVVMRALFDVEHANPSGISDTIGLSRGAVSKLVDRLVAKRFVHRRWDRSDRRCQMIGLTDVGRGLVPVLAELADRNDAEFLGGLDDRRITALSTVLKQLCARHGLSNAPIE